MNKVNKKTDSQNEKSVYNPLYNRVVCGDGLIHDEGEYETSELTGDDKDECGDDDCNDN